MFTLQEALHSMLQYKLNGFIMSNHDLGSDGHFVWTFATETLAANYFGASHKLCASICHSGTCRNFFGLSCTLCANICHNSSRKLLWGLLCAFSEQLLPANHCKVFCRAHLLAPHLPRMCHTFAANTSFDKGLHCGCTPRGIRSWVTIIWAARQSMCNYSPQKCLSLPHKSNC